jgi:hypothetical protein
MRRQWRRPGVAGNPQALDGSTTMVAGSGVARLLGMLAAAYSLLGAVFDLNGRPHYIHSGWFLISAGNLAVVIAMIVVFVLALVLPFPGRRRP